MIAPHEYARLLDTLSAHLATCPVVVDLASVEVTTSYVDGVHGVVQLSCDGLADLATALLAWADTLTEVTVTAWRPPDGERVHLVLASQLPDGLALRVYGGIPYTEHVFSADLQPGGRHSIAMSVLLRWATGAVAA